MLKSVCLRHSHPKILMFNPVKIALVDDSEAYRVEAGALLRSQAGFHLVAACANGREAIRSLPHLNPDVVLVDLNLPDMSGVEVVRELHRELPETRLLILTIDHDGRRLIQALSAGAVGYLVKTTTPGRLLEAVGEAMAGGSPISSNVARLLVQRFQPVKKAKAADGVLTDRERRMLMLFAAGGRAKEVAKEMRLSVHTVRAAVRTIYRKLHAQSVAEAVAKFSGSNSNVHSDP